MSFHRLSPLKSSKNPRYSASFIASRQWSTLVVFTLGFIVPVINSVPVNVALNKPVIAFYTCGVFGLEHYNTLSDIYSSVSDRPRRECADVRTSVGDVSTTQSSLKKPTYPPEAMVDGQNETHWQSVSRSRAYTYGQELIPEMYKQLDARIDIDLLQEFLAESLTIQLGDAITPQKVSIFKSFDGKTYSPWVYAVTSFDLCQSFFSTDTKILPTSSTDTICIVYAADEKPPGDVIFVSLGQVGVVLKEWQRVRYIRISFYEMQYVYPYNVLANNFNHYSVSELTVLAECPCNGLHTDCQVSKTSGIYECVCGGNTKGRYCESCQSSFNQFPFTYGQPCVECNCHDHASSCFYQSSVEAEQLSLDKNGTRRGGGVCMECQHNTSGINCEKCLDLYYRPVDRVQTAVNVCVPCNCNASGSAVNNATGLVDCLMNNDKPSTDGKVPGDCYCKANVIGFKCTECKEGFFNLQQSNPDGCTPCDCHTPGTIGGSTLCTKDVTGQCNCKSQVEGRACDTCKDGFYGLTNTSIDGCLRCDCDIGGSLNQVCDKVTGQCVCRSQNIVGRQCNSVMAGFYYTLPHGVYSELEDSIGQIVKKRDVQNSGYSGQGYIQTKPGESFTTLMAVPSFTSLNTDFIFILTYRSKENSSINIQPYSSENSSITLPLPTCSNTWCQANTDTSQPATLFPGPNLISLIAASSQVLLDKLVAFPIAFLQVASNLSYPLPVGCDLLKNTRPTDPSNASVCQATIFSLTMGYFGAPMPCNCDPTGSINATCNVSGGQCECQPGVVGRKCDSCSPDHYAFSSTGCSACQCGEYGSACDEVTGQCNCPDNTMGRQCEFCVPNTWGWNKTGGCMPCECNLFGSVDQQCNAATGVCTCLIGVEGTKCDQCMGGFYNLNNSGCSPCMCNEAGSVGNVCNKTSGQCQCKRNTHGRQCDVCINGTFGLDLKNPQGCLDCICMGITSGCVPAGIRFSSSLYPLSNKTEAGSIPTLSLATMNGNIFNTTIRLELSADKSTAVVVELTANEPRLFWKVPESLVFDLVSLYGSNISFIVNFVIVEGQPFTDHKAVLISKAGTVLTYPLVNVSQGIDSSHTVSLRETDWQISATNISVTRGGFLKVLASSPSLLIPASFSAGNHTSRLSKLEFSIVSDVGPINSAVEQCSCGNGYDGRSCQLCKSGYRRENVSSSDYLGVCVPCFCNGHTAFCDPDTGICQNCQHNTEGDNCEMCLPGYHGNATLGTDTSCSLCPCYPPRVISTTCQMDSNSTEITCTFCQEGYTGSLCDHCEPLHYGDPKVVNGTCQPCLCNSNSDICNNVTGNCENCQFNTTGSRCESCISGFYGNASLHSCQECGCSNSSNSTICDSTTGQCSCIYGVEGRTCDYCMMTFWGFHFPNFTGCKPCGCLEAGSSNLQCNNDTGACTCKSNTVGDKCDTCSDGYYGLPLVSCQACECNSTGSFNVTYCNKTSGQCECKPGVGGRQCDQCLPFFVSFNITGCVECDQCQKTLGGSIQTQSKVADDILNRTLTVRDVQMEDTRLQELVTRLNESLLNLGLAGSNATSVTDIIINVKGLQKALSTSSQNTETKAWTSSSAVKEDKNKSISEVTRQANMAESAGNLTKDINNFEQSLNAYVISFRAYSTSASQYLNQNRSNENATLSFQPELARATNLLSQVQNTSSLDAINDVLTRQISDVAKIDNSIVTLSVDLDNASKSVTDLTLTLNTQYFKASSVESTIAQARTFHSQAEDLSSALNIICNSTENKITESLSTMNAARTAARNTDAIYLGNALLVMSGGSFLAFPSGVTNFDTGTSRLRNLLTSIPLIIDRLEISVNQSESYVQFLEESLMALKSSHENISSLGTDTVEAIENFEKVVNDLSISVATIASANQLIVEVSGNVSGDAFNRLHEEYAIEKANAEAWRSQIMNSDYRSQVLQSSLDDAKARLDNEGMLWSQADSGLATLNTSVQTLNTLIKDNTFSAQLNTVSEQVNEALSTAQTAITTAVTQNSVLDQKQGGLGLVQGQVMQAQELQQNMKQRVTTYQTNFASFQANLTAAKSSNDKSAQTIQDVTDKIKDLETKLAGAENILAKLRKPLNFDGSQGVELQNEGAGQEHLYDDLVLEVRKPANFTDGLVFFADNPSTTAELEIGFLNNSLFFEFSVGTQTIRVTSSAQICADCWAEVHASRYANVGYLSLTLLSTGEVVSTSQRGSNDPNSRTLTLSSNLYIGSLPDTKQTTKVANKVFRGCLYELTYQRRLRNLWTNTASTGQTTKCCQFPPSLSGPATIPGASFNGFGYLVLLPVSLQISQAQQISLEFQTFSSDAFLLRVVSPEGRAYINLFLQSGTVVWETLTSSLLYTLQSVGLYATGQWVQVIAKISVTELNLSVKYVTDTIAVDDTKKTVQFLNLTSLNSQHIILGTSADPTLPGYTPNTTNFAGCMRNVIVTTPTSTTTLSLTENVASKSGVTTDDCYARVINGLRFTTKSAYAQILLDQIAQIRYLEFDIVTEQSQGILLYISAPQALRYLYLAVFGGNIILVYRQDTTDAVVTSGHYISDGQLHTIKMDCLTFRVSLKVDGITLQEGTESLNADHLTFVASSVLFLGGLGGASLPSECPVNSSLIGGISRLIVNDKQIPFMQSNILLKQDITLAGIPVSNINATLPEVEAQCAAALNVSYLSPVAGFRMNGSRAINWNDLLSSISLTEYFERNFVLNVEFSVYKSDGVLIYVADTLANPSFYLTVYILDGHLYLKMKTDTNNVSDMHLSKRYNTGASYQLVMMKVNGFVSLTIDSEKDHINNNADSAKLTLFPIPTSSSVYIGGLGLNNLSSSPLPEVFKTEPTKVNFAGAVYSIGIRSEELNPTNVSLPISQLDRTLYPSVPAQVHYGVSLSGQNSSLKLGQVTTPQNIFVEITFSTVYEPVLFFLIDRASSSKFMAMDTNKQQVRLHLYPSFNGITEPATLVLYGSVNLCDGQQHVVQLSVQGNSATVTVDNQVGSPVTIPTSHSVQIFVDGDFYVGGYTGVNPSLPAALNRASLTGCVTLVKISAGLTEGSITTFDPTQYVSSSVGTSFSCP